MFRRLSNTLPKDPEFPADLEKLGYYINDADQIRSISHPTQGFNFFISKNERACETHREAMNTCIRKNLAARFRNAGLQVTRLSGTAPVSETTPHIPILTTPNLSTAKRVLIYFGENSQDLGIFAYRTIDRSSLASGSVLDFVEAIKAYEAAALGSGTAIVIANLGQLIWYRRGSRAMTVTSWNALPRKTGVDNMMKRNPVKNSVEGHRTAKEHVGSVMAYVKEQMKERAKAEIIGVGEGAEEVVLYLDLNWEQWKEKVAAICVGLGFVWRVDDDVRDVGFKEFWGKRARAYLIHNEAAGVALYGRQEFGCNCYSSGENANIECIMPNAYKSMLDFFQLVYNLPGYEEQPRWVEQEDDQSGRVVSWEAGKDYEMVKQMEKALIEVSKEG